MTLQINHDALHAFSSQVAKPFRTVLPWATYGLGRVRPGCGAAVYIPSSLLRYLTFKLTWDLQEARTALASITLKLSLSTWQVTIPNTFRVRSPGRVSSNGHCTLGTGADQAVPWRASTDLIVGDKAMNSAYGCPQHTRWLARC